MENAPTFTSASAKEKSQGIINKMITRLKDEFSKEDIKKEILGKNNEDLTAYLSTFSDIKDANVEYRPSFINSRIPQIESRVEIVLDK